MCAGILFELEQDFLYLIARRRAARTPEVLGRQLVGRHRHVGALPRGRVVGVVCQRQRVARLRTNITSSHYCFAHHRYAVSLYHWRNQVGGKAWRRVLGPCVGLTKNLIIHHVGGHTGLATTEPAGPAIHLSSPPPLPRSSNPKS